MYNFVIEYYASNNVGCSIVINTVIAQFPISNITPPIILASYVILY